MSFYETLAGFLIILRSHPGAARCFATLAPVLYIEPLRGSTIEDVPRLRRFCVVPAEAEIQICARVIARSNHCVGAKHRFALLGEMIFRPYKPFATRQSHQFSISDFRLKTPSFPRPRESGFAPLSLRGQSLEFRNCLPEVISSILYFRFSISDFYKSAIRNLQSAIGRSAIGNSGVQESNEDYRPEEQHNRKP